MDSTCWGSIEGNGDFLVNCCFDLGKDRCLFCEWMASLEGCDVVNSSCKDFFFWLLDSGVECWAEVFVTNMIWVLRIVNVPPA